MSKQSKEIHKELVEELNELEHAMKDALEENEHFHTLEEQLEKRKPQKKDEDK